MKSDHLDSLSPDTHATICSGVAISLSIRPIQCISAKLSNYEKIVEVIIAEMIWFRLGFSSWFSIRLVDSHLSYANKKFLVGNTYKFTSVSSCSLLTLICSRGMD